MRKVNRLGVIYIYIYIWMICCLKENKKVNNIEEVQEEKCWIIVEYIYLYIDISMVINLEMQNLMLQKKNKRILCVGIYFYIQRL